MLAPPRATAIKVRTRAVSSVGRAPALHAGCRRFESVTAHQPSRLRRFGRQAGRRRAKKRAKTTGRSPLGRLRPTHVNDGVDRSPSTAVAAVDVMTRGAKDLSPQTTGLAVTPLP